MTTDLMRLDTLTPTVNIVRNMDRLMDRVFGPSLWSNAAAYDTYDGTLPVDISETETEVIVRASLPGYRRDDVEVQLHQGVLSIKATHDWQEAAGGERFHRRERAMGPLAVVSPSRGTCTTARLRLSYAMACSRCASRFPPRHARAASRSSRPRQERPDGRSLRAAPVISTCAD